MKKILALTLALLLAVPSFCQSSQATQKIKEMYAQARELVQQQATAKEDCIPENNTEIVMKRCLPGTGEQTMVMKFFYNNNDSEDSFEKGRFFTPVFVTVKYNIAAVKFYEEYLFDEKGKPAFLLRQSDSYSEEGKKDEQRFYIADGKVVKKTLNLTKDASAIEKPLDEFKYITKIFNDLIAPIH